MANTSNIMEEQVIHEFYHQDGENVDLPMVGASTKIRLENCFRHFRANTEFPKVIRQVTNT